MVEAPAPFAGGGLVLSCQVVANRGHSELWATMPLGLAAVVLLVARASPAPMPVVQSVFACSTMPAPFGMALAAHMHMTQARSCRTSRGV